MTRLPLLAPAALLPALLLAVPLRAVAPPADLLDAERQVQQIAALSGDESASVRLARFFDLFWRIEVLEAPDFATYVGWPGLDDRWPDLSPEGIDLARRIAGEELAALAAIDRGRLTPSEQVDYDLARRRLDLGREGERFQGASFLRIDSMNGVDIELTTLLGAMPGRTVHDFEAMLARLRGYPAVVDQDLALLARGLAAGITPPRASLRAVPDRVASLLTDDPWQSPVLARFRQLPEGIPADQSDRLRAAAARAYTEGVAPALRRLHTFLAESYVPRARETFALRDLPDGAAWYAFKLRIFTTTDLTPEQIHQLGLAEVARIRRAMDAQIAVAGFPGDFAAFSRFLRTDPRFFYDRPEDLLAGYRDIVKRIDPELIRLFGRLPRLPYGVKAMEGDAAKTAPVAYYSNGSLAGGSPGWFLINTWDLKSRPKWGMEALALHEAVPGHHLQYSLAEESEGIPQWRKWDVYPAFSEGWGLYAESLGDELGLYRDPYSKFGQLTNEVWRAIRMVVDTGVHTMGWTRQQAIDYYRANCAKTDHEIEAEVDRILVQPGTVPAYKVGELKIRELRTYAERELGERFDLRAFHDHLLGHGQLPLDLLEKSVKEWVAERKAEKRP